MVNYLPATEIHVTDADTPAQRGAKGKDKVVTADYS